MKRGGLRLPIKLSAHEQYAAGWMLLAILMAQLLLAIPLLIAKVTGLWQVVACELVTALAVALVVGGVLRRIAKLRPGVTPAAYAHAFLAMAIFRAIQGTWLLATGRPWGKFARGTLPRADSAYDFAHAALLALVAAAFLVARSLGARRQARG